MKKILFCAFLCVIFIGLSGCQSTLQTELKPIIKPILPSYNISSVATIAITNKQFQEVFPESKVENIVMEDLVGKGYVVPSRGDLEEVLKEITLQRSDITENNAARIGKILNVDAIFIFELTGFEMGMSRIAMKQYVSSVSIVGRLINVEDSRVIWIENKSTSQSLAKIPYWIPGSQDPIEKKVTMILSEFPSRK